jgi:hypothetical protein
MALDQDLFKGRTVHFNPSVSYDEYPYSSNSYNPMDRKKHLKPKAKCLNKNCKFPGTEKIRYVMCPYCNHALFWSRE